MADHQPTGTNGTNPAELRSGAQSPAGTTVLGMPGVPAAVGTGFEGELLARLLADADAIIARYPQQRSALLPLLHLVQSEEGYVSPRGIAFCAHVLGLTTAEVSAVSTFYTQYRKHPGGTYTVGVCINTLCAVMGGDEIFESLSDYLGVGHDQTTPDGSVTLERIECNAACDYAPVMMVNWEFFDNQTPGTARALVDELRDGADVVPTRGAAKVCTFKEISRVLAGFTDGRADEGVGAGEPTLVGLRLARQHGWAAPDGSPGASPAGAPAAEPKRDTGREPVREQTSAHDAPAVDAESGERAGTTAGKPGAEAETTAPRKGRRRPSPQGQQELRMDDDGKGERG